MTVEMATAMMEERIAAIRKTFERDMEAGARDAKNGYYDKWYRHHRTDDGAAYDAGWNDNKDDSIDYQIIES